jgi:hypothetical protein
MQIALMWEENNKIFYQEGHVQIHLNVTVQIVRMEIAKVIL